MTSPSTPAPTAEAAAYLARLRALVADHDPVEVMGGLVPGLREAVSSLTDEQLAQVEGPGKWSMLQVVDHLANNEMIFGYRMRMILAHDTPEIQGYEQDWWATRLHSHEQDVEEVIEDIASMRGRNLRLIGMLSAAELARYGVHSERGAESVAQLVWVTAAHDLMHLRQLERIRSATR